MVGELEPPRTDERLERAVLIDEGPPPGERGGWCLAGYQCTDCGNRVKEVGTDGRECPECGNIVWKRLIAEYDEDWEPPS